MTGITQRLGSRVDGSPERKRPQLRGRMAGAVWCISRGKRDPTPTGIGTGGFQKKAPVLGSQPGPTTALKLGGPIAVVRPDTDATLAGYGVEKGTSARGCWGLREGASGAN